MAKKQKEERPTLSFDGKEYIIEDMDGEIKIYTGLFMDRPLGATGGPQNVPPDHRTNVRLREMNERDLPDAKI